MKPVLKVIAGIAIVATGALAAYFTLPRNEVPAARVATLAGQPLSLSDLRGKVVLVSFWATSCDVCVAEMPRLVSHYEKFAGRGYETVAVAMSYDHPNRVADFVRRRHLPFKVALDTDGRLAEGFRVLGTPTGVVLDRRGRVLTRFEGEPDWRALDALVEKSLSGPA